MIYLGGFILAFTAVQLLVSAANLVFRQKLPKKALFKNPMVSVLIPARDEEKNIGNLLNDLAQQNYQNLEILVFDDQSTDQTAQIVQEFAKKNDRIRLIQSTGLPEGWNGKNFGCYSLANIARGEYFLFLDADVRLKKGIVSQILPYFQKYKLGLLSVFPNQIIKSPGEYFTLPIMNYILLSLLPLVLVRTSGFSSLSAANGQCMLFNAETYRRINPHEKLKSEKVEDIKIARLYKKEKIKIACLASIKDIRCRMYTHFTEAVNGFSKNVFMFFGGSAILAFSFWLITTFGFVAVLFSFSKMVFLGYLAAILLTRIFISAVSHQNILLNMILMIPQQLTLGVILYRATANQLNKQFVWKGRNIS